MFDRGVLPLDVTFENDPALFETVFELPATPLELVFKLVLKLLDAFDDLLSRFCQ